MGEWRTIDTAPKDGRPVRLGWLPNGRLEYLVRSAWSGGQWQGGWTPTHWKPAPPAETAARNFQFRRVLRQRRLESEER